MTREEKVLQLKQDFDEVYEAGKQAEYDAFWDAYQNNGNRVKYTYAFSNGWDNESFKPKYDIIPTDALNMFFNSEMTVDLVELCERQGVVLDFSKATNVSYLFGNASASRIGVVDVRSASNNTVGVFYNAKCTTIDKIIIKSDGSNTFHTWFAYEYNLINVNFEGVIGRSGLNLQWSTKLSKASIESIIDHLDLTEGSPARSITLSLTAVNKAFETSEGANDGADGDEFNDLCASARAFGNWTISLV